MVVNNATGEDTEACPCNQLANFAFDSTSGGNGDGPCAGEPLHGSFGGHRAGNYTVTAHWAVTHSDVRFRVDDWSLTVEKARVS
jgi:hypothetical protein